MQLGLDAEDAESSTQLRLCVLSQTCFHWILRRCPAVQVQLRPLGPGMMQQVQAPCTRCSGTGYQVPPDDQCPTCSGKGLIPEKKVFEVHINKVPRRPAPPELQDLALGA